MEKHNIYIEKRIAPATTLNYFWEKKVEKMKKGKKKELKKKESSFYHFDASCYFVDVVDHCCCNHCYIQAS